MSSPRHTAVHRSAHQLDRLRAAILRWMLQPDWLRRAFIAREQRLFLLYGITVVVALLFAAMVPLWVLLIGPIIYGYAHLFSSTRYFHHALARPEQRADASLKRRVYGALLGLVAAYALYRVALTRELLPGFVPRLSEWQGFVLASIAFMAAALAVGWWLYRKEPRALAAGAAVVLPLSLALWTWPVITAGALVLVHNFVGFVYWIQAGRTARERRTAWWALAIFAGAHVAIFAGLMAPVASWSAGFVTPDVAGLSVTQVGALVLPWTTDVSLRQAAVIAFAFGQWTHYYVWLKAIPDQQHRHRVPTTFRQSLKLLAEDFGATGGRLVVYVVAATAAAWMFVKLEEARVFYLLIAGFHGYLEIAGLGLLSRRRAHPAPQAELSPAPLAPPAPSPGRQPGPA